MYVRTAASVLFTESPTQSTQQALNKELTNEWKEMDKLHFLTSPRPKPGNRFLERCLAAPSPSCCVVKVMQVEWDLGQVKNEMDETGHKCGGLAPGEVVDCWRVIPVINITFDSRKDWKRKKRSSQAGPALAESFAVMPEPNASLPPPLHPLEASQERKRSRGALNNNGKKGKFKAHIYAFTDHPVSYYHQAKMDQILNFLFHIEYTSKIVLRPSAN